MSKEIKVGAEVTMSGTVQSVGNGKSHPYCVRLPSGIGWYGDEDIASFKNPSFPEPASGYAVVDGLIAWQITGSTQWETDSAVYLKGWSELLDRMDPQTVVELVPVQTLVITEED